MSETLSEEELADVAASAHSPRERGMASELLAARKKLAELEAALETASIALITGLMTLPVPVTGQGKRAWSTMIDARDAIDAALPNS